MKLRPTILDRYLFREFATAFLAVMAFCSLLVLVGTVFEKLSEILENDPPMSAVFLYFATSLPYTLIQIVPIAAMLAVLFSIGGLARYNEIIALVTSGVHSLRIAAPVLFGGLLIALATFAVNELAIPQLQRTAERLELELEGKDRYRASARKQLLARGRDQRFYVMRVFDPLENQMIRPVIIDLHPDGVTIARQIEAEEARLVSNHPEQKKSLWKFKNPQVSTYDSAGHPLSYSAQQQEVVFELEEDLPRLLAMDKSPEEMNFRELARHIQIISERGQPTHALETDLILKVLFPLGIIVILVIGFSYAVRSRAGTMMTLFGYGILWAFAYYGTTAFFQALGHSGAVPALVAATIPLGLFTLLAIHYLRRSYVWHG